MGKKVRDKISGIEGIATGLYFELDCAPNVVIEAEMSDDKDRPKSYMVDLGRVEIIGEGVAPEDVQDNDTNRPGGGILPESIRDLAFR